MLYTRDCIGQKSGGVGLGEGPISVFEAITLNRVERGKGDQFWAIL